MKGYFIKNCGKLVPNTYGTSRDTCIENSADYIWDRIDIDFDSSTAKILKAMKAEGMEVVKCNITPCL